MFLGNKFPQKSSSYAKEVAENGYIFKTIFSDPIIIPECQVWHDKKNVKIQNIKETQKIVTFMVTETGVTPSPL